jgi:hypothetical protein
MAVSPRLGDELDSEHQMDTEDQMDLALQDMRIGREAHARRLIADRAVTAKLLADGWKALERSRELIGWFAGARRRAS